MTKPRYVVPTSTKLGSTLSTVQIYATLRAAMLAYEGPGGDRLSDYLGPTERVYVRAQPDPPVFPYVTLLLQRTSLAEYNGYRETGVLEVQAIGRPESQLPLVESAMDLIDQCLTAYTSPQNGLVFARARTRQTVPQFTDPADSAVVAVLASYQFTLWPQVLTARRVPTS